MANIRGLVNVSGIVQAPAARLAIIWIASALLFWHASTSFKSSDSKAAGVLNLAFGNFVLASILLSYHLSPSDLSIALLPLGLFSQYVLEHTGFPCCPRWMKLSLLSIQLILFLPPLHVISLAYHMYVYPMIPILTIFLLTSAKAFRVIDPDFPNCARGMTPSKAISVRRKSE
jgi:hypothetical protein